MALVQKRPDGPKVARFRPLAAVLNEPIVRNLRRGLERKSDTMPMKLPRSG